MATRITVKGQVTIPKTVRDALGLSPGDGVNFTSDGKGEFVVRKAAPVPAPAAPRREPLLPPRGKRQIRRRAAELLALLRGLD
jgi:AbrB family looped-hinge helix DNA binding protein